jgi:hypothetical protein
MGQVIELIAGNSKLVLRSTEGLYKCTLFHNYQTHNLGQEQKSYITRRLFSALCEQKQDEVIKQSFKWVLSLAKVHSSLYVLRKESTICLLWQYVYTKTIAKISMSYKEGNKWCNQPRQIAPAKSG